MPSLSSPPRGRTTALAGIALALVLGAAPAGAECGFSHLKSAKRYRASLVQAFIPCNGSGNVATEGGIPACRPPQTFAQQGGSPSGSWRWGLRGSGTVVLGPAVNKVFPNPADTADLAVRLDLDDVTTFLGAANGDGALGLVFRVTMRDRVGGPMTIVDFPASIPITAVEGRVRLRTTLNTAFRDLPSWVSLPGCTSIEVEALVVTDPNFHPFATPGIYLPDL